MAVKLADRLAKTGKDLFIELVRAYSVAEVEDYFKNGLWQDDLMKAHIELLDRHRREAGAPKLPDLKDVVVPDIPVAALTAGSAKKPTATALATPVAAPASVAQCSWCIKGECWTHGQAVRPVPGMEVTKPAEAEQRLIGLFIKKFDLDEAMANEVINNRPYHQRRYIYGKFKTETTGEEGAKELQNFAEQCDKDMSWPDPPAQPPQAAAAAAAPPAQNNAAAALAAALAAMPAAAAGGVKRPAAMMAGAPAAMDANKSARMAAVSALAQRLSGARGPSPAIRAATPNPAVNPAAAILAARAASASPAAAWRANSAPAVRAASPNPAAALAALLSGAAAAKPNFAGKGGIRPRGW